MTPSHFHILVKYNISITKATRITGLLCYIKSVMLFKKKNASDAFSRCLSRFLSLRLGILRVVPMLL